MRTAIGSVFLLWSQYLVSLYRLKYVRVIMPVLAHMISGLPLSAENYFGNIKADFDTDPTSDILHSIVAGTYFNRLRKKIKMEKLFFRGEF